MFRAIADRLPQLHAFSSTAFACDLTGAIYSLSRRFHPADVLRIAALFFSASEIEAALGLIDITGAQIDVLTGQDISKQIGLASESI